LADAIFSIGLNISQSSPCRKDFSPAPSNREAIFYSDDIMRPLDTALLLNRRKIMARDYKEDFFRLDGAWASFELMSIRRREDYLRPFKILRCKIDDQVDFQAPEALRSATEATVRIEIFGDEEWVAASGQGPVHALDNAMRKILEKHYPQLAEVHLEEFNVRLLHGVARDEEESGASALVRVLAIFSDGTERWGTVGVAADILQASVECLIDGLEWKLRGEHKH
jgi:2-isopropylmalate synthase